MTDDIVTRLRAEGEMNSNGDGTKSWWPNEVCQEAANHIEEMYETIRQLETQLDYWIKYAHRTS